MKSILQVDEDKCYLCEMPANGEHLDWHHVFEGPRRQTSEKYGLKVKLHHIKCHENGIYAVHNNSQVDRELKRKAQIKAMKHYGWSVDDWLEIFHKSWL